MSHSTQNTVFDAIVVGGSFAGLSATLSLLRASRTVLIIDAGEPANRFATQAHNLLGFEGLPPADILAHMRQQFSAYSGVFSAHDRVVAAEKKTDFFEVKTFLGQTFWARTLLFTTGLFDALMDIPGKQACWGKSVFSCPYCHGYEFRAQPLGIFGNGDFGFNLARTFQRWSTDLTFFTFGAPSFSPEQWAEIEKNGHKVVSEPVSALQHNDGWLHSAVLQSGATLPLSAVIYRSPIFQVTDVPEKHLGCTMSDFGLIKVDEQQHTSVPGVFAAGDCATPQRMLSYAIATGSLAGMAANKWLG